MPRQFSPALLQTLLGAALPLTVLSASPTLAAIDPGYFNAPSAETFSTRLAQASMNGTVLAFETDTMAVRIFRRDSDLLMNLYNKTTDIIEVNGSPAELVSSTRDQTVYKNSLGEAERFARITAQGATELEIVAPDGAVILKQPGFNTIVGIAPGPTDFQGNNFAPGTGAIVLSAQAAKLRAQPRLGSEIVGSANRREIVQVIDRVGNPEEGFIWYQVTYQGTTGWVRGDLLQPA